MFKPILLFFIIFIIAVLFILYQLRAKIAESEGFATQYTDFDMGGNDQYSPTQNTTVSVCDAKCKNLGERCPGFVMDFRSDGGVPRNNCWLKTTGAKGSTMSYAQGVNTYTMKASANFMCPNTNNIPEMLPQSDPTKSIVIADWDVTQIKNIHSNLSFNISDADMPAYIQHQVKLGTAYSTVSSSAPATTESAGGCPIPSKKWMFSSGYSDIIQGYVNNNVSSYNSFLSLHGLNIAAFQGIEGLTNGPLVSTNITNQIIADAKSSGFTLTTGDINAYIKHIHTYVKQSNSSKVGIFKKLVALGINSSDEYNKFLNEMVGSGQSPQNPKGIGFVITDYAPWFVDTLPQYGIKDSATMKLFRDDVNGGLYYNFGFKTPFYPTVEKQGHQVYFWYLSELIKLGVGVKEFKGFASIHKEMLNSMPNTASEMDLKSGSWDMVKLFPKDPFLKLIPVYTSMKFNYKTGTTPENTENNFRTFCTTVKEMPATELIDKLKRFADRMREYGMSSFMEYAEFVNYLTSSVGTVANFVDTMQKAKTYIKTKSGFKIPSGTYKTGRVKLYDGRTVEIFDYQLVKFLISELSAKDNKYGVSPGQGFSFTGYVSNLNNQNWTYNNTIVPTIKSGAKYVESEVRSKNFANRTYESIEYNESTDPSKMVIQGFDNMNSQGSFIGSFSDWVVSLFYKDQEGLTTNNRLSDRETLRQFGIGDADKQLPPIIKTFKDDYEVTNFNEMIYLISCLRRIGVQHTDLIRSNNSRTVPCLQHLKRYKITQANLDVFTRHMKNAGFNNWSGPYGLYNFIDVTREFGVNTNELNYKQFIYMIRKFGCNLSSQSDLQKIYVLLWVCRFIGVKYDNANKISNMKFERLTDITEPDTTNPGKWKTYVNNFSYFIKDKVLEDMHTTDNTDYHVYKFDNFIENCIGRQYRINNFGDIINRIIFPMYIMNRNTKKYEEYPDLFNYVNILNGPFIPLNDNGEVDRGQYLMKEINSNPDKSLYGRLIQFITEQPNLNLNWDDVLIIIRTYIDNDYLALTNGPINPNFEMPFKVEHMICFIYDDEMSALVGNNSSKYDEKFGSNDKIIEYMMDMVVGIKLWMADISKVTPFDSDQYNDIIPTVNAIILHPIYMFRWMEKLIQENKTECTEKALKIHAKNNNQNKCYQTIPASLSMRRRASYVEDKVGSTSAA